MLLSRNCCTVSRNSLPISRNHPLTPRNYRSVPRDHPSRFAEFFRSAEFSPHFAESSPHSAEFSHHFAESSPHSAELPLRFAEFFLHYEERSATSETPFRSRSPCPLFIQLLLKILLMVSNARIIWFIVQRFCIVLIGIFI